MRLIEIWDAYFLKNFKKSLAFYIFMCYNIYKLRDKQEDGIGDNFKLPH